MRGQKSRSGEGGGVRPGFEGGQTALYRRLPKFVGKPMKGHTKLEYELIKLEYLNECAAGSTVDIASLVEKGVATKANKQRNQAKVIGNGELTVKNLTVKAHAFTESAKAAIEANGGTCILMSPTRPIPLAQVMKKFQPQLLLIRICLFYLPISIIFYMNTYIYNIYKYIQIYVTYYVMILVLLLFVSPQLNAF
jgi:large subunit ribosomal protein L15